MPVAEDDEAQDFPLYFGPQTEELDAFAVSNPDRCSLVGHWTCTCLRPAKSDSILCRSSIDIVILGSAADGSIFGIGSSGNGDPLIFKGSLSAGNTCAFTTEHEVAWMGERTWRYSGVLEDECIHGILGSPEADWSCAPASNDYACVMDCLPCIRFCS